MSWHRPTRSGPARTRFAPRVEALEARDVPTSAVINGNLVIRQSSLSDEATVRGVGTTLLVVTEKIGTFSFTPRSIPRASVTGRIVYYGLGGNDTFINNTALRSAAYGGAGNDRLYGGTNTDWFHGDTGNDLLDGRAGDDFLRGVAGNDSLLGGDGNDYLYGGAGDDLLGGGAGNDWLYGEAGNDLLGGGDGNDWLFGSYGRDRLSGGGGHDFLHGGIDGIVDELTGGLGGDRFVKENYRFANFTFNRDRAVDFNPTQDGWHN